MLALPIARRELLVLSRAAATWQRRLISSLAVFLAGIVFALIYHYAGQVAFTPAMHLLGAVLSMICLFAGVALTADSIAEERREGTLGLLLLTNLSPFEIVLGKLVAHAVVGFYAVLCALPLLSMSMIFGGMRLADLVMYLLSALNLLFFSATVGMFASSLCAEKRRANGLGIFIIMFFWLLLPLLGVLLAYFGAPPWSIDTLSRLSVNLPSSLGGIARLLPSTTSPTWWNFAWPQILAWALIGLTIRWLPGHWEHQASSQRRPLRDAWKAISYGTSAARLKLRRRLLDRNPFMWLAARDRLQAAGAWMITLALLTFGGFFVLRGPLQPGLLIPLTVALSAVLQMAFSAAAGAQLLREYEQGTLELVLSTPLSVQQVLRGQFAASRRSYRTLFGLTFILLWVGILLLASPIFGPPRVIGMTVLAFYSVLLLLNFYALGWVGMWCVMKAPDPKRAHHNAFFLITILPGMMFGLIVACGQFLNWLGVVRLNPGPQVLLPLLFSLAFANCIYWLLRARRELPAELRLFAFRRYTPDERLHLFGQIGRLIGRLLHRIRR